MGFDTIFHIEWGRGEKYFMVQPHLFPLLQKILRTKFAPNIFKAQLSMNGVSTKMLGFGLLVPNQKISVGNPTNNYKTFL